MPDDVAILVDGREWHAWEGVEINLAGDNYANVGFTSPFEPERPGFRETFQPFSYKSLQLLVDDEVVFTGTLVGVDPAVSGEARTVKASAYSLPAVLVDCNPPASAYPLELNGLKLRQIAERLLEPFGLSVQMDASDGATFGRVAMDPGETVHSFLVKLAKERGLIVSDTPEGALRFLQSTSGGQPVARLREGQPPLLSVTPTFQPQQYFSELTGLAQARAGRGGAKYTVQNERLAGVLRPHAFTLDDTDGPDAPTAVNAKLGRMFGNAVSVEIGVPTWRDPAGELWSPNTTLLLEAPGAMIFRETEWLIREVTLKRDAKSVTATMRLVLPGAFSGEIPEVLPWE